ncbi:putative Fe-S cluster assembly domain superfamily [Dioscorea sansibarensis]
MALLQPHLHLRSSRPLLPSKSSKLPHFQTLTLRNPSSNKFCRKSRLPAISASLPQLHLTEDNIRRVLVDAKMELGQIFDGSVGITGQVDLAEVDGPFVKLSLKGRFWHKRVTVLERIGTYLKNRIPEILEVEIEDEKQLDDSPENF